MKTFTAGDHVEVTDASNKLYGTIGVVQFFVADNIYVRFSQLRLGRTKMFFPDQISTVAAPQRSVIFRSPPGLLRIFRSLQQRMRP